MVRGGKTGKVAQPVSVFHKRQPCFLCVTLKTSLFGTDVNEERLRLFLSSTETEPSPPPAYAPAPSPLLKKSGVRNKDAHCFTLYLGGGTNMAYTSKTRIEGGLCKALTPNGVSDNPVIIARDCGRICGKWGKESYS